jgi:hypothetical protein
MNPISMPSLSAALALASISGAALAQQIASRVVTDATGTRMEYARGAVASPLPYASRAGGVEWIHTISFAGIPECIAIANSDTDGYAGSWLNGDRLQRFELPGDNVPEWEAINLDNTGNPRSGVSGRAAAAADADLAVFSGGPNAFAPPLRISAFRRASNTAIWSHTFADNENPFNLNSSNLVVSSDGSTVAVAVNGTDDDGIAPLSRVYFFRGDTGVPYGSWIAPTFVGGLSLTDDGTKCLVTAGDKGILVDRDTLTSELIDSVIGSGGRFVISGNGNTIAMGGFDFKVFKFDDGAFRPAINFSIPTSWFGWGLAVSRDGSTVGVMTHNYLGYLVTRSFTFDVGTGAMLGSYTTSGSGTFQDSVAGAAMSDDGSVFAAASWGTEFNDHPEVLIFDRTCTLIGSIDTPGSVFGLDTSNDGTLVMSGSKGGHANSFGNAGNVTLYRFQSSCPCAADFDGSGGTPDITDIDAFFSDWLAGDGRADADCSGGTPDITDIDAFFVSWLAGGC